MKTNSNTVLIIIAAVVVALGAYWYFFTGNEDQPSLTVSSSENPAQTQFQTLMSRLPTSFKTDILSDSRFTALVDLATPIAPESAGRIDPFATIPGVSKI